MSFESSVAMDAATITLTNINDSGEGGLRQPITNTTPRGYKSTSASPSLPPYPN